MKTKHPASEGVVALLEPFIDTVVICTMTALVIIFFNMNNPGEFNYDREFNTSSSVLMTSDSHKAWVKENVIKDDMKKKDKKDIMEQLDQGHEAYCLKKRARNVFIMLEELI